MIFCLNNNKLYESVLDAYEDILLGVEDRTIDDIKLVEAVPLRAPLFSLDEHLSYVMPDDGIDPAIITKGQPYVDALNRYLESIGVLAYAETSREVKPDQEELAEWYRLKQFWDNSVVSLRRP